MLLPLICIVLTSQFSTAISFHSSDTTDEKSQQPLVDVAFKALTDITTGSGDVLLDLKMFGEQATSLMNAINSIADLIPRNGRLDEHSEKFKTLSSFNNRTGTFWRDFSSQTIIFESTISEKMHSASDVADVVTNINLMKLHTDLRFDLRASRSEEDWSSFKRACTYDDVSPDIILTKLSFWLVRPCEKPFTPIEARELAEHRSSLISAFQKLRVEAGDLPDPGQYMTAFRSIYPKRRDSKRFLHLETFKRPFPNYQKAVEALFEELRGAKYSYEGWENLEASCLLRSLIYRSNFDYPFIKMFALELKNNLIYLIHSAAVCSDAMFHGDPTSTERYTKQFIDQVTQISSFTSKWLNDSLIASWSSAHDQILKEQIIRASPRPDPRSSKIEKIDKESLQKVVNHTLPLLVNTGLPNYDYEIAVVRAEESQYQLYFEGGSKHCSLNKGVFGFDTIISRTPVNSSNPLVEQDRRNFLGQMINETIQTEIKGSYNESQLSTAARTLKNKVGEEFRTNFHCWGIVRQWSKFYEKCPKIDVVTSSANPSSITTFSYEKSGSLFQDCQQIQFLFFA